MKLFKEALIHKPEIIVINKCDVLEDQKVKEAKKTLRQQITSLRGTSPFANEPLIISGAAQIGLEELKHLVKSLLPQKKITAPPMPDSPDLR